MAFIKPVGAEKSPALAGFSASAAVQFSTIHTRDKLLALCRLVALAI
jgi:hypothetical protein